MELQTQTKLIRPFHQHPPREDLTEDRQAARMRSKILSPALWVITIRLLIDGTRSSKVSTSRLILVSTRRFIA
jgi:hypothetical protein